jgi:hypothetical protein
MLFKGRRGWIKPDMLLLKISLLASSENLCTKRISAVTITSL